MNGSVTVRAQESEILEPRGYCLRGFGEWSAMADFADVAGETGIDVRYQEATDLANELPIGAPHDLTLRACEGRVAFPPDVEEEPRISFDGRQLGVGRDRRLYRSFGSIGPCAASLLAIEKVCPRRSPDRDLLRKPSKHVRRCASIVGPSSGRPGAGHDFRPFGIGKYGGDDGIVVDEC